MRALVIDSTTKQKISDLITLAEASPYSLEQLEALSKGFDPRDPKTRGDDRINLDFTIDIPMGYRVTYTNEYQPLGLCRHLSVSVLAADKCPNPVAVGEIMTQFGFVRSLENCIVWQEKYAEGFSAINVMEQI